MKRIIVYLFILFFGNANSQCAMCKAVLESEVGQITAEGINDGIVYLMLIPYIIVGGLALIIYKFNKIKSINK